MEKKYRVNEHIVIDSRSKEATFYIDSIRIE